MQKDIYEVLLNPTRVRIMQALVLGARETITASEICSLLSDVPRTTLYRHINILIEAGVLQVAAERKIRGSVERTLSLNAAELSKLNETEDVSQMAFHFLMRTYAKFELYFSDKADKADAAARDKLFLRNAVLMLSDQEFDDFLAELRALFQKYHFEDAADGRKPRDISLICAPLEQDTRQEGNTKP